MHINYITSTSSVSPLTSSSYLSSFASSTPSLPGGVPNQQHLAQTHSLHSQLHGRLSGVNGLGTLPSDDEDIEDCLSGQNLEKYELVLIPLNDSDSIQPGRLNEDLFF